MTRRRVPVALALVLVLVALLVGGFLGYVARGGRASGQTVTDSRTVPVITVTVPRSAAAP